MLPRERATALLAVNPNVLNGCTIHFARGDKLPAELQGRTKKATIVSSLPHRPGVLLVQSECNANEVPTLALVDIHTYVALLVF